MGEIDALHAAYGQAARRVAEAGFEWSELNFAYGNLGASFVSPIANRRTDRYCGPIENRTRFHLEAIDAVKATWPKRLPLTMQLGSGDFNEAGV